MLNDWIDLIKEHSEAMSIPQQAFMQDLANMLTCLQEDLDDIARNILDVQESASYLPPKEIVIELEKAIVKLDEHI